MPSRDVNAAKRLAEASWRRDNDSNVLVEQMIRILGKDARFIVKCPLVKSALPNFCFDFLKLDFI